MKNISTNTSKQEIIKIRMPENGIHQQTCNLQRSFNGMHAMYKNVNADFIFSSFATEILKGIDSKK